MCKILGKAIGIGFLFNLVIVSTLPQTVAAIELEPFADDNQGVELIVIDKGVQDYQSIKINRNRFTHVVYLEPGQDGLSQLGSHISQFEQISSVHIVSHAQEGVLQLGSTSLDDTALRSRSAELSQWRHSFVNLHSNQATRLRVNQAS